MANMNNAIPGDISPCDNNITDWESSYQTELLINIEVIATENENESSTLMNSTMDKLGCILKLSETHEFNDISIERFGAHTIHVCSSSFTDDNKGLEAIRTVSETIAAADLPHTLMGITKHLHSSFTDTWLRLGIGHSTTKTVIQYPFHNKSMQQSGCNA